MITPSTRPLPRGALDREYLEHVFIIPELRSDADCAVRFDPAALGKRNGAS